MARPAPAILTIDEALPRMQALASRVLRAEGTGGARHHPGQLTWSARYAEPQELEHGPVAVFVEDGADVAWAWLESPTWGELCVEPGRTTAAAEAVTWLVDRGVTTAMTLETERTVLDALHGAGFVEQDFPWFTHHELDLGGLGDPPVVDGYAFRHVEAGETELRAACHRAAWSAPPETSKVTAAAYTRLTKTAPYRRDLDWVAVAGAPDGGEMVACLTLWLDEPSGVVLLEPVGTVPEHRGRGLAGALSLAALHHARGLGASTGLVCPRGDEDHPVPQRVYRGIGFRPVARTLTLQRPAAPPG